MIVCIPVNATGEIGSGWGRAAHVAVADVRDGAIAGWATIDVGWDALHDTGTEGGHHARIARFLQEHAVEMVVAGHMGPPMAHMLESMGIGVRLGATGDARRAIVDAANAALG
jgi:predicted Fe-Mo cluster-binding NifX family protein